MWDHQTDEVHMICGDISKLLQHNTQLSTLFICQQFGNYCVCDLYSGDKSWCLWALREFFYTLTLMNLNSNQSIRFKTIKLFLNRLEIISQHVFKNPPKGHKTLSLSRDPRKALRIAASRSHRPRDGFRSPARAAVVGGGYAIHHPAFALPAVLASLVRESDTSSAILMRQDVRGGPQVADRPVIAPARRPRWGSVWGRGLLRCGRCFGSGIADGGG